MREIHTDPNILTYTILLIVLIFLLSNKEIVRSKLRSFFFESKLKKEQGELERRMSERTEELVYSEHLRAEEIERNIQFGKLAKGLFHDLINPLTTVSLYIERLSQGYGTTEETKSAIDQAVLSSKRMREFMDNIKGLINNCNDAKKAIAVSDLSKNILIVKDLLAYKARMVGTSIVINDGGTATLAISPTRLQQLFINIISNSIEASEKEPGLSGREKVISISCSLSEQNISVTIADEGCGFSDESLKKAFKHPFTTKKSGTGIGLITIRNIVENELHGTVQIENRRQGGTKTTLNLPIHRA